MTSPRPVGNTTRAWAADPDSAGEDGDGPAKLGPNERPIWFTAGVSMLKEVWRWTGSLSEPAKRILITGAKSYSAICSRSRHK